MKSVIYDFFAVERLLLNIALLDLKCVSAFGSTRNGPIRYLETEERAGYGSTSSGINRRTAYTSFSNSWMLDDHGRNRKTLDRRFRKYFRCDVFVDFRV
jgi:hypothetical protein